MFKHAQISWIFLFLRGVGIFDFVFLSHFLTKQWCFWAHLKGNYLQSWKNTLLLTLFHFFKPQRALKWKSYFFRRNFAEAWKGLLDSWQAYFTKWTTSGSPPVGLQGHQDSKSSHSWVILYVTNWSSPCISGFDTRLPCKKNMYISLESFTKVSKFHCKYRGLEVQ